MKGVNRKQEVYKAKYLTFMDRQAKYLTDHPFQYTENYKHWLAHDL